jgi:hypothetical protein
MRVVELTLSSFIAYVGDGKVCTGHTIDLAILEPTTGEVEPWFEMRLAYQRGAIAGFLVEMGRDAWRINWQWHTIREDTMGACILTGDHGCAGRHADDVLIVRDDN